MSKITLQNTLEELFNKNQTIPRIAREFKNDKTIQAMIAKSGLDEKFCLDLLVQMALHRRCNLPTLVGLLRKHFNDGQQTADAIHKAAVADLVDYNSQLRVFITIGTVPQEVQNDIDKYQFPLPMVVEPMKVTCNSETGYMVHRHGSVILKDNHHDDDVCLDHLNRVNKIKLCINERVAFLVRNEWRNLDKPKADESLQDYRRRVKAFEKFDRSSKEVIDLIISEGNEFYLTHAYDKRGRVYPRGYQINYAGNPWNKSCVEFANKELI